MTRAKKNRNALLTSILSLLVCVSMLVSTTFAWLTDVDESGLNQIIAGNLDVELVDKDGEYIDSSYELFEMPELWEPGAVAYAQIAVANVGTLDLKASLSINYEDVNHLDGHVLSEVLKYAIIPGNADLSSREAVLEAAKASTNKGSLNDYDFTFELDADTTSDLQTLVVFWEPSGDNIDNLYNVNNGKVTSDGNPLQINLGVKVFATQLGGTGHEEDSFGPDYDLNANTVITVPGSTTVYATINEAIEANPTATTFNVSGPIDTTAMNAIAGKTVTFKQIEGASAAYFNFTGAMAPTGADITFDGVIVKWPAATNYVGLQHVAKLTYKNCTIYGQQFLYAPSAFADCTFVNYDAYAVWTYGATEATFEGCDFVTGGKAILVYNEGTASSTVTVNNCTFNSNKTLDSAKAAIEVGDYNNAAVHKIIINNSTAPDFAANNSTSPLWGNKNNMPKDRLTVIVDDNDQVVDKNDRFADMLEAAAAGDEIVLDDNYKLNENVTTKGTIVVEAGTAFTLDLNGKTIFADNSMNAPLVLNRGDLTVTGGTLDSYIEAPTTQTSLTAIRNESGTLTLNNVTVRKNGPTNGQYGVVVSGGKVILNNSTITANRGGIYISGTGSVEMNGGSITQHGTSGTNYYTVYASGTGTSSFDGVALIQMRSGRAVKYIVAGCDATFANCTEE